LLALISRCLPGKINTKNAPGPARKSLSRNDILRPRKIQTTKAESEKAETDREAGLWRRDRPHPGMVSLFHI
jgi:hypothetical protein